MVFQPGESEPLPPPAGREEMERTLEMLRNTPRDDQVMRRIGLLPR